MSDPERDPEADVRAACEEGAYDRAADLTLRAYGGDILGFLTVRLGDEALAREAFSDFSVDLWKGLKGFGWRCPVRVWAFTLARNAGHRALQRRQRNGRIELPFNSRDDRAGPEVSRTPVYMRTTVKSRVRALRAQLSAEERELLVLRIDKRMTWPELATVVAGRELEAAEQKREAARLRKRFQLAKERLRELARSEGLLDGGPSGASD